MRDENGQAPVFVISYYPPVCTLSVVHSWLGEGPGFTVCAGFLGSCGKAAAGRRRSIFLPQGTKLLRSLLQERESAAAICDHIMLVLTEVNELNSVPESFSVTHKCS